MPKDVVVPAMVVGVAVPGHAVVPVEGDHPVDDPAGQVGVGRMPVHQV